MLAASASAACGVLRAPQDPELVITSDAPLIGHSGKLSLLASEPVLGLASVKVELVQNGKTHVLEEKTFAADEPELADELAIGKDAVPELGEGELIVRATAVGRAAWPRSAKQKTVELKLSVRITPPTLAVEPHPVIVVQGGSEVVTYEVGESSVRDGVSVRDWFFSGHPIPGEAPSKRFALFGIPYDLDDVSGVKLIAEDALGNVAETSFITRFTPHPMGTDQIHLDDKMLEKVTSEIISHSANVAVDENASLAEKMVAVNGELRHRDARFLRQLAEDSRLEFLWRGSFVKAKGTAVKGYFADRRTYYYQGQVIDTQDHLGIDLASVVHAPVPATNSGIVLFANYLGIFGNAVVIDHGFGLMSLYGHLSETYVTEGQAVERGAVIGRTGSTGLSGGDHLHFTMLVGGMPVTPLEWWNARWIARRIKPKLGRALGSR